MKLLVNKPNWKLLLSLILVLMLFRTAFVFAQNRENKNPIIFIDTFETTDFNSRWEFGKSEAFTLNRDPSNSHSGLCSMEVTVLPGQDSGHLARIWFDPGFDIVFACWYVKFETGFDQGNLMHMNRLGAQKDRNAATAGNRPNGFDFFRTALEPWRDWGKNPPPGEILFYSYFPLMEIDSGTGKYYGNFFKPKKKVVLLPGKWYQMAMMLKANTAGSNNGEQAFWINGKLIGHFKNITWRFTNELKINTFSLGLFIHENQKINRVWYDDVVVYTKSIGP